MSLSGDRLIIFTTYFTILHVSMGSNLLAVAGTVLLLSAAASIAILYGVAPYSFWRIFEAFGWPVIVLVGLAVVAFGLSKKHLSQRYARIIATAFVITGLIVPAVFGAVAVCAIDCQGVGPAVIPAYATGTIVVPSGSGNGTFTLQVKDNGPGLISSITLSNTDIGSCSFQSSSGQSGPCAPVPDVSTLIMTYKGQPVSPSNPVALGGTAKGSMLVYNVTAGVVYGIQVDSAFTDGNAAQSSLPVTAQA